MNLFDVVGYSFEGAIHCVCCAEKRFPNLEGKDKEGNEIHPYFYEEASQFPDDRFCDTCREEMFEE